MERLPRATMDFEARSAVDVRRLGTWLYSRHSSTQPLCLAYLLPGFKEPKLWHRAHPWIAESPPPDDLFAWIANGGMVEAHNQAMEENMWENIMVPQFMWPAIPKELWLCSAAKASAHGLPRALEDACRALDLPQQKDMAGHKIMLKVAKPKRLTKAEKEFEEPDAILWNENEADHRTNWEYCRQDVRAEEGLSRAVPDLTPKEFRVWQVNQECNRRGVLIDVEFAKAALIMADKAKKKLNATLLKLTGIESAGMRAKISEWLNKNETLFLPDTQAATLDWVLRREGLSARAKTILRIVRQANRTSTTKYKRMLQGIDEDGRARDLIAYCGAERTGRFSGKGIQIHNLAKGELGKTIYGAVEDIKTGDVEWCEAAWGDVMELLSGALRGAIIPSKGKKLYIADYAAIEARVVLWQAGARAALEVFKRGEDIYCDLASTIYGRKITKADKSERQFGKQGILGLGFGMGWIKFLITCRVYGIFFTRADVLKIMGVARLKKYEDWVRAKLWPKAEEKNTKRAEAKRFLRVLADVREDASKIIHELALMKFVVDTYRNKYPEVPELWKGLEQAAILAVRDGEAHKCGVTKWFVENRFLYCQLPSGRRLSYVDPEIKSVKTVWGEITPTLRFMGLDKVRRWSRQASYGGKLTENTTQAIARDVMAEAMVRIEDHPVFQLLMTVHDELVSEAFEQEASVEEYEKLVSKIEPWFKTCPISADSDIAPRYHK